MPQSNGWCDPAAHIATPWLRAPESTELEHAKAHLSDLEEAERNGDLERPEQWWRKENLALIRETGRIHIWSRSCLFDGCGWQQTTVIDPKHPDHDQRALLDEVK